MKKILLLSGLFISLMLWAGHTVAQCTPDPTVTDPTGAGRMDPDTLEATVLQAMSTTLTIICPTSAVVGGNTVSIHHITVKSILNKPNWMSYACNPTNNEFAAGVRGCALVSGTPPTGSAGTVYMGVLVDVYISVMGNPILAQSDYNSGDTLVLIVHPATGIAEELGNDNFNMIQNQPNPFSQETRIGFNTKSSDKVSLKVTDLLGNTVYTEQVSARSGENYFDFTGSQLSNGIYFYSVANSRGDVVSQKMIKGN
jgi:hypothetical protein